MWNLIDKLMSLVGQSKTSSSTLVGQSKDSASLVGNLKPGAAWAYDEPGITYDMVTDSEGRPVYYNSLGDATTLTGLAKTAA